MSNIFGVFTNNIGDLMIDKSSYKKLRLFY